MWLYIILLLSSERRLARPATALSARRLRWVTRPGPGAAREVIVYVHRMYGSWPQPIVSASNQPCPPPHSLLSTPIESMSCLLPVPPACQVRPQHTFTSKAPFGLIFATLFSPPAPELTRVRECRQQSAGPPEQLACSVLPSDVPIPAPSPPPSPPPPLTVSQPHSIAVLATLLCTSPFIPADQYISAISVSVIPSPAPLLAALLLRLLFSTSGG